MPYKDLIIRKAYHQSYHRSWYLNHPGRISQTTAYQRTVKKKIFDHYGRVCVCCGETEEGFLSLDHINGGGNQDRKKNGTGYSTYLKVIRDGFPDTFQTLCMNCNHAKGIRGVCPHVKEETATLADLANAYRGVLTRQSK